jgi:hypothetical protein
MLAAPTRVSRVLLLKALLPLIAGSLAFAATSADAGAASPRAARPHVWVKSPARHHTVSGTVRCHVVVHDRRGIRKVRFSLDGQHLNSRYSWPYNCTNVGHGRLDTAKLSDGEHHLALRAWNRAGRSRLVRWGFRVANAAQSATAPSVPNNAPAQSALAPGLLFDGSHVGNFALIQSAAANRIQEVADPVGDGPNALRFRVPDGDVYPLTPTSSPRAQALSPAIIHQGQEFWIHDQVMLPRGFPSNLLWFGLAAVYGPPEDGSSPVALQVVEDRIVIKRNSTYGYDQPWSMPLVTGRWIDYVLHERFGHDGWIELWINGERMTFKNGDQRLNMQTMDFSNDQGTNHVRITNYRPAGVADEVTVYHRGFKVGRTKDSVGAAYAG